MWHEARKTDKLTQKLIKVRKKVSEKRRAENRVNPTSLLQIYGVKSKLSLDPDIYKQATKSLVPWQGDTAITIDRFDVRASLSSSKSSELNNFKPNVRSSTVIDSDESDSMRKLLNYERYRILIQNEINGIPEEVALNLVAKSESGLDAKMRKLQNNRFGTSGEASMPSKSFTYQPVTRSDQTYRNPPTSQNLKYNLIPPPISLNSTEKSLSSMIRESDNFDEVDFSHNRTKLVDLNDYDIGNINHVMRNYKFLSSEEYSYLAAKDVQQMNPNDILEGLTKLSEKELFYGPQIPPELASGKLEQIKTPTVDEGEDSPIGQRSPSGADIPLRAFVQNDVSDSANRSETEENPPKETMIVDYRLEPRRASTPLIYKKNCNLKESMSREGGRKRRRRSNRGRTI